MDKEAEQIYNSLIDYSLSQVYTRMIVLGEPFEVALANYVEELENDTPNGKAMEKIK